LVVGIAVLLCAVLLGWWWLVGRGSHPVSERFILSTSIGVTDAEGRILRRGTEGESGPPLVVHTGQELTVSVGFSRGGYAMVAVLDLAGSDCDILTRDKMRTDRNPHVEVAYTVPDDLEDSRRVMVALAAEDVFAAEDGVRLARIRAGTVDELQGALESAFGCVVRVWGFQRARAR